MSNLRKNFYGVSLGVLAFSLVGTTNAHAQTCVAPPNCATLGFTKTTAECTGKTILKCPFDQTAVYCPGYEESTKTYGIGDTYMVNGAAVGKVISVSDCGAGGGGMTTYDTNVQCLGLKSSWDIKISYDSFGNQIYTHPDSSITCTFGRVYDALGYVKSGYYRIGSSGGGCAHGTVSSPAIRTGTRSAAMETCAKMTTGGMSWYLPSTYNGYFFGYNSSQPYLNGIWAVADGCFYNGIFHPVSSSIYQDQCQNRTGAYPDIVYTDKEMSYYCISMFQIINPPGKLFSGGIALFIERL